MSDSRSDKTLRREKPRLTQQRPVVNHPQHETLACAANDLETRVYVMAPRRIAGGLISRLLSGPRPINRVTITAADVSFI